MRTKNWTVREAKISDAKALTECMFAAYEVYSARFPGNELPPLNVNYEEDIRQYSVWVAEFGGKVIGGLILTLETSTLKIANVAVHPQFQGIGLGKDLLELAETEAKKRSCDELNLTTHVLLDENISFYAHLGWTEFERDDRRVYMRKKI